MLTIKVIDDKDKKERIFLIDEEKLMPILTAQQKLIAEFRDNTVWHIDTTVFDTWKYKNLQKQYVAHIIEYGLKLTINETVHV